MVVIVVSGRMERVIGGREGGGGVVVVGVGARWVGVGV